MLLFWKIRILSGLNLMLARKWTTGLELVSEEQIKNRIQYKSFEPKHYRKNVLRKPGSKNKNCSVFP